MTRREAFEEGKDILTKAGIEESSLDAWYLLEWSAGITRADYYVSPDKELEEEQKKKYLKCIEKRQKRIPLQHITGEQEFMGLIFHVDKHVLIPRQDTEVLVEEGLKKLESGKRVLDLCTGSGCVIISLERLSKVKGTFIGADISEKALDKARENAKLNGGKIEFLKSDLFDKIEGKFDMILSNPPYIRSRDIEGLQEEVRVHDPYIALDGGEDGLSFYRRIISKSREYLNDGGWLLLEIGYDQGEAVRTMLEETGFRDITVRKDLAGLDRVLSGRYDR